MKIKKIGDYCEAVTDYVANGSFKSLADNVKYLENGYARVIRLVDHNNNFNDNAIWVSKNSYEFLNKTKLFGDEIIISNVGANYGTVFKCPTLEHPMTLGPNAILVKMQGNNDYYYYWFLSPFGQNAMKSISSGSAIPKFNKTEFKKIEIPVPHIELQNKVVHILSKIDQKIELNNQTNDNLLAIA